MKRINILAILLLLFVSNMVCSQTLVGNQAQPDQSLQEGLVTQDGYHFQEGDTVIISKETTTYLTGEKPSPWVYFVRHTVKQVGGTRFPDGILIDGILSWVEARNLYLASACQQTIPAQKRQRNDRPKVEEVVEEVRHMDESERKALEQEAEAHNAQLLDTIAPIVAPVVAPVVEEETIVVSETPETIAAPETEVASEPAPDVVEQPVQEDSTKVKHYEQFNRFTVGLRGGAASLMHDAPAMGNWKAGFDALLDLQYAHYWLSPKQNAYGLIVGLSAGYVRSGIGSGVDSTYSVSTSDGQIDYTIQADDVTEHDGQLQVEIPVLFSLISNRGFFFNVGPKVVLPVYNHYNQRIRNPHINAYFPAEGVTVTDEVITGLVSDNQLNSKGRWQSGKLNVMLTAELGYEWQLRNRNSLALGAYANYSVFDLYKNTIDNRSLIDVTAPSSTDAAVVDIVSATDTYTKGMGYFDCGIKLAYHFNFWKK